MRDRHSGAGVEGDPPFALVLGALIGVVGWVMLAMAGTGGEWVALLWATAAAGLVPVLVALADQRDTTAGRLGAAGLLVTGGAILGILLVTEVPGELAVPFLPLLIAYVALLITTGKEGPTKA